MKTCSKCRLNKKEKEFGKAEHTADKLQGYCRKCFKQVKAEWRAAYPEKEMLIRARRRAKASGIAFDIELSDVVLPAICPILRIPLVIGNNGSRNSPSLDRVDNSKGYVKGNVRVISKKANSHKSDMTVEQVERLLKYMKGDLNVS